MKIRWKKLEKSNVTIPLNAFSFKKEKTYPAYVSKYNSNREKQVILLTIWNREKREAKSESCRLWDYLAVKKTISIINRNNFLRSWWFLLSELP